MLSKAGFPDHFEVTATSTALFGFRRKVLKTYAANHTLAEDAPLCSRTWWYVRGNLLSPNALQVATLRWHLMLLLSIANTLALTWVPANLSGLCKRFSSYSL